MATVMIHLNDRKETYVGQVKANLKQSQAAKVAQDLNLAFAEQGLRWYAIVRVEDDES